MLKGEHGCGLMVSDNAFCVFCIAPGQVSAVLTVKLNVPVAEGVPEINPDELMPNPAGNAPETILNPMGDCPPDVVI